MRLWLFHPLIFYPLLLLIAALVVFVSLKPQNWPRPPAPVAGSVVDGALVLSGAALDTPSDDRPIQYATVVRDLFGRPQTLRIAVTPGQAERPGSSETGTVIQLAPASAALLNGRRVLLEINYRPLPVNAASGLAVSLQGPAEVQWQTQPIQPLSGTIRYDLRPASGVTGIGLRAITGNTNQAYGIEIVSIRAIPRGRASN